MNYSMQEYANDIVFAMQELCDADEHPAPDARLGVGARGGRAPRGADPRRPRRHRVRRRQGARDSCPTTTPPVVRNLIDAFREVSRKNFLEVYHDALEYKDECLTLFALGHLSLARARRRREGLLGHLPEDPAHRARARGGARGARGPREGARRHLLLQLLDVPVAARLVGHRSAVPDPADPPAARGADAPRGARRHHLRLRRQDRQLHRSARRQARARAAPAQRTRTTTSASSSSARTRRSSATCTTCSATPTRSSCRSARAATTSTTSSPATP